MLIEKTYRIEEGKLNDNGVYIFTNRFNLDYNYEKSSQVVKREIYELEKKRKALKKKGKDTVEISKKLNLVRKKIMKDYELLLASILVDHLSEDNYIKVNNEDPTLTILFTLMEGKGYYRNISPINKIKTMLERLKEFGIIDYKINGKRVKIQLSPFIAWFGEPDGKREELLSKILKAGKKHTFSKHPIQTWHNTLDYIKERAWEVKYYIEDNVDRVIVNEKIESYHIKVILIVNDNGFYIDNNGEGVTYKKQISTEFVNIDIADNTRVVGWVGEMGVGFSYDLMKKIDYIFPNQTEYMESLAEKINHHIIDSASDIISNDNTIFRSQVI